MSQQCVHCRSENSDTATVCKRCGAPLEDAHAAFRDGKPVNAVFQLDPGIVIDGRYLIMEEIERDMLGLVYRVKDSAHDDREYILKILHPALSNDADARRRFEEETAACIDLNYPPRVLFDRLESGQDIYYYLTGRSLNHYLLERRDRIPPFSPGEIRVVMKALLDALDYAHQFTIHNHISPATVILIDSFPNPSIRLLHFRGNDDILTYHLTGTLPDTQAIAYMAPEQIKNPLASDLRADLYSVGAILYHMTTGRQAVGAFPKISELLSDSFAPLDEVTRKVLSADVDQRHASAKELSRDISSALDDVETALKQPKKHKNNDADQESGPSLPSKESTGRKRWPMVVSLLIILGLAAGGYVMFKSSSENPVNGTGGDQQTLFVPNPTAPVHPESPEFSVKKPSRKHEVFQPQKQRPKTAKNSNKTLPAPQDAERTGKMDSLAPDRQLKTAGTDPPPLSIPENSVGGREPGSLTIVPVPQDAKIRILNIKPVYKPGMKLRPGRYHIEVSAPGYQTRSRWLILAAEEDLNMPIMLKKEENITKPLKTAGVELVYVKGGCFQMGQSPLEKNQLIGLRGEKKYQAAYSDEVPQHQACVDDFYMGKYEITVRQWHDFTKETGYQPEQNSNGNSGCYSLSRNKWSYNQARSWKNPGYPQTVNYPVVCISYNDIERFLKWIRRKSDRRFRLPTEAEWEYAARSGGNDIRFWGNDISSDACKYANVAAGRKTGGNFFPCNDGYTWASPVGSFQANTFGLHDMLGNVWEWCMDQYSSRYYAIAPRKNPRGPSSKNHKIVIRGGSWNGRPSGVRSANRNWVMTGTRKSNLGFRVVSPITAR